MGDFPVRGRDVCFDRRVHPVRRSSESQSAQKRYQPVSFRCCGDHDTHGVAFATEQPSIVAQRFVPETLFPAVSDSAHRGYSEVLDCGEIIGCGDGRVGTVMGDCADKPAKQ
jgi:hypothetical protein